MNNKTDRFNTSKEELHRLGSEFNKQAFTIIDDLFNLTFWLLLSRRSAKKIVLNTYKQAIHYCDKTKAGAEWNSWLHRSHINTIRNLPGFADSKVNQDENSIDDLIFDTGSVEKTGKIFLGNFSEKLIVESLNKLPRKLLLPFILKDIYNQPYITIAGFLDTPNGVASTRIYRGRKLFFKHLADRIFNSIKISHLNKNSPGIFKLREAAVIADEELTITETPVSQETFNTDPLMKTELEIQLLVKQLMTRKVQKRLAPARLKRKIKRAAKKRFFLE